MKPHNIYLLYENAMLLLNDLEEARQIHPIFNEFLYAKYYEQIIKKLNWKSKKNPLCYIKIINIGGMLDVIDPPKFYKTGGDNAQDRELYNNFGINERDLDASGVIIKIKK